MPLAMSFARVGATARTDRPSVWATSPDRCGPAPRSAMVVKPRQRASWLIRFSNTVLPTPRLALGVLLGMAAWLWKGSPALGAVVAAALAVNTVVAVSIGGTVPLLLKRLGADPAVASGPVLTTVTDMCGFFLVLGIATLALGWL